MSDIFEKCLTFLKSVWRFVIVVSSRLPLGKGLCVSYSVLQLYTFLLQIAHYSGSPNFRPTSGAIGFRLSASAYRIFYFGFLIAQPDFFWRLTPRPSLLLLSVHLWRTCSSSPSGVSSTFSSSLFCVTSVLSSCRPRVRWWYPSIWGSPFRIVSAFFASLAFLFGQRNKHVHEAHGPGLTITGCKLSCSTQWSECP